MHGGSRESVLYDGSTETHVCGGRPEETKVVETLVKYAVASSTGNSWPHYDQLLEKRGVLMERNRAKKLEY